MQTGVTNPLSDTSRIYNPNKNISDRDSDLKFISDWVPELQGYSLPEILAGAHIGNVRVSPTHFGLDTNEESKRQEDF